ncbi:core-binding factor subunit beta-like [Antedon mediterranea]|uniref:core-binding factor subunit beta-like n=1 Tax=Antedon mediterranea TaxID=105859 RepID=UPI003AF92EBE
MNSIANMPRVVPDQRAKFENDELFRKLCRESEIRYTGFRDRSIEERQVRFQSGCREGHSEFAIISTGTNLHLQFVPNSWADDKIDRPPPREYVDFERERGKVHLKAHFILNGVSVLWTGWIDMVRLDGLGCIEFDHDRAATENKILLDTIEQKNRRLREFEERQRLSGLHTRQERRVENEAQVRVR